MVREETDKKTNDFQTRHSVARDLERDVSDASKRKGKQKWVIDKPKLDIARKLRGVVYFIDPDDGEFKDIMKNACRKLEIPMPVAKPCKLQRDNYRESCRTVEEHKTKYACIVEADESTRKRMEGSLHKNHEDHAAGKGMNSLSHYNLVHKFIPMPQAMKIPDAKAAVQLTKVRNKNEVTAEEKIEGKTAHFASLMDLCHLKISELEPQCQKYKGRSYAVFTEQGSSASQMTAAKVMDGMSRLPGCAGQAADDQQQTVEGDRTLMADVARPRSERENTTNCWGRRARSTRTSAENGDLVNVAKKKDHNMAHKHSALRVKQFDC